jgi:hypothetical protein
MRFRNVWILFLTACSLFAAEKTQQFDFVPGGLLRLENSRGALTIEAWDKSIIELSTRSSNSATAITAERHGNELVVTTVVPKRSHETGVSYHLWVPRETRLAIHHRGGEVNVEGVAADIEASLRHGDIFLYLPADVPFTTNALTKIGSINVPGDPSLRPTYLHFGRRLAQPAAPNSHVLKLKAGYGDIYVLRETPAPPPQTKSATN